MRPIREQMAELTLPVSEVGGVIQPGVDLDYSAALLDSMESSDASR